jgi:hypothetical protein
MSEKRIKQSEEKHESGVNPDKSSSGLSQEEAALVEQVAGLHDTEFHEHDAVALHEELLQPEPIIPNQKKHTTMKNSTTGIKPRLPRWMPAIAISSAVILFGLFSLLAVMITGFLLLRGGTTEDDGGRSGLLVRSPYSQNMAVSYPFEAPNQTSAALNNLRGFVEVKNDEGGWEIVEAGRTVSDGGHIRTGSLSSGDLIFYDGSTVHLGPNTEIVLDELIAPKSGDARVIELTLVTGETDHEVAQSDHVGSYYKVNTPFGTGEAKSTTFSVVVTHIFTRFFVDDGAVAVTNIDVTIVVIAGESTTVYENQSPEEPVFRIVGEGEITSIGDNWEIAGQSFVVDSNTIIVGDPQVGDWVYVEGHLSAEGTPIAEKIILLRRAEENSFKLVGSVDEIEEDMWIVTRHEIAITDDTSIEEGIIVDDVVVVVGFIMEDGTLVAESIRMADHQIYPFEFIGVVQEIDESWLISNIEVAVDETTEIIGEIVVGMLVKVEGWILEDGTWMAEEIKPEILDDRKFEFVGVVESVSPWVISGIEITTREWTEIDIGISVSDRVKVEGWILEDGTWLADEIELVVEEDEDEVGVVIFEIIGQVESIDPWSVSGLSIEVDDQTVIEEGISVDDWVKVVGIILEDGSLLAKTIQSVEEDELGCLTFVAIVDSVEGSVIVLIDGTTIDISVEVVVEGELKIGSVISITVCTAEDGTVTVVALIVLFQLDIIPPDDDTDEPKVGKALICHIPPGNPDNRHTISVGQGAVNSHLGHGDILGSCQ